MGEIWMPISGYVGLYEVSNHGRIRSVDRIQDLPNCHGWISPRHDKGRIFKPTDNGHGYLIVQLRKDGKRKNHYVHRLVAGAFLEKPDGKDGVNHIDRDRQNNMVTNLEWCTQKENVRYSAELMRHPKDICKPSKTGEKYITVKNGRYRVQIRQKNVDVSFDTLEEAVEHRNEVMKE